MTERTAESTSRSRFGRRSLGPAMFALVVAGFGMWQAAHLGGSFWDTDEGLNVIKAYLVQNGTELYTYVWSDQPPGLTQLLAWSFTAFGPTMTVARGVVLAHALVLLVAIGWIVRETGGGWPAAIGAAVLLMLAPNFFWASRAVMIGLPALGLATLSIAMAMAYARTGHRRWLLLGGVVFGLGLLEKLIGLYLIVPLAIAVWGRTAAGSPHTLHADTGAAGKDGDPRHTLEHAQGYVPEQTHPSTTSLVHRLRSLVIDGAVMALGSAIVLGFALAAYDVRTMIDQAVGTVIAARGIPEYALDRAWSIEKLAFWLFGEHRFLIGPALLGVLVLMRARSNAAAVLLSWLVLTLAALLNQTPLWPKHHFLALLVVMVPLAGVGFDRGGRAIARLIGRRREGGKPLIGRGRERGDPLLALAALAAAALMLHGLPDAVRGDLIRLEAKPFKENGELPESDAWTKLDDAVELVRAHTSDGDTIVTDHGVLAFRAGRRVPTDLAVISGKRLAIGGLTAERLIEITREGFVYTYHPVWGGVFANFREPDQPAAVVFWDGDRLTRIPEFDAWVRANYELAASIDDDYEIWLRPKGFGSPAVDTP